jgi:hypothetical protein
MVDLQAFPLPNDAKGCIIPSYASLLRWPPGCVAKATARDPFSGLPMLFPGAPMTFHMAYGETDLHPYVVDMPLDYRDHAATSLDGRP